ncbi:MAG: hypothetical protein FWG20_01765 [Candidatus Cloacimonetes bacterium]|nr:hypothetical protein [Candidatus Cloacimonadota bacterium]
MWTPIPEVLQKLNISLRTLRRKVKSEELTAKLMKIDGKGNNNLFIWIEATNVEKPVEKSADTSSMLPKQVEIIINEESISNDDEVVITDDLQQVFLNHQKTENNVKILPSTEVNSQLPNINKYGIIDNTDWKNARKQDRERAIAKFEITKCFMDYRKEMKAKGVILAVSGANFVKKLNKGDFCRNALNKLNINKLAIQTLIKWECMVKASDDIDSPVSLLEAYRHCGRPSKIEPFIRKMIKDLSADPRDLSPEWIYNYINDQLEFEDKELDISKRSIQLMVAEFKNDTNTMARSQGKSAIRNKVKLHNVRINDILPGELWESDGHKCNVASLPAVTHM